MYWWLTPPRLVKQLRFRVGLILVAREGLEDTIQSDLRNKLSTATTADRVESKHGSWKSIRTGI